jgi:hypothetical protein
LYNQLVVLDHIAQRDVSLHADPAHGIGQMQRLFIQRPTTATPREVVPHW